MVSINLDKLSTNNVFFFYFNYGKVHTYDQSVIDSIVFSSFLLW